jgi:arylsulfatase A-like enzyme
MKKGASEVRKLIIMFLLVMAFLTNSLWVMAHAAQPGAASRPHIVYILADDLGWKDVGFHGSDIQTPNIDRLAREGAQLEQFYAQSMCTPSRAALMTGRYPFRYGLQTAVIPSASKYGLATDEWLLPQALKEAGYTTAIVGKWHLGHADRKYWPSQRGFDYQYGAMLGEIDYFTHAAHGKTDWYRNNQLVKEPGYVTHLLGTEAVRLIDRHDPKVPLFLYLTFTAPHAPYQAPKEYLDKHKNIADPSRRAYAAMVNAMDDEVGRVVAALERRKMRDHTLIVFQSDNGGPRSAQFTGEIDMSKSTIPADNGPYRDGKGSLYEGGTRVVALANWPEQIKPGTGVEQPIHMVDMFTTLAGLAGAPLAKSKPLDGLDVWPAIAAGKASPREEVVYNVAPFLSAIRNGDWKLVWQTTLPSRVELFNLAEDAFEKTNLAGQNPQKVVELQQRIETLAREGVQPLFLLDALGATKHVLFGSVATPDEEKNLEMQP